MTEKELNKLTTEETNAILRDIDDNYASLNLPIVKPKYNSNGELINEKEVKKSLKLILPILIILWQRNIAITTAKSINIMNHTNNYYNIVKKGLKTPKTPKTTISTNEWSKLVDKIVKNRQSKVKIQQVIKGNARILNKKVQNTVLQMYKDGKNYKQTAKKLQQEFGYNKNKAKQIAITEKNYYKSEAQLKATKDLKIKKTWIHNGGSKEPREAHMAADGTSVIGNNSYFTINGYKTLAPQHFGVASEDIYCRCTLRIEVIDE